MSNEDISLPIRHDLDVATNRDLQEIARALVPEGVTEVAFADLDEALAHGGYAEENGAATTLVIRCILALGAKLVP